jgi:hypothetical protein
MLRAGAVMVRAVATSTIATAISSSLSSSLSIAASGGDVLRGTASGGDAPRGTVEYRDTAPSSDALILFPNRTLGIALSLLMSTSSIVRLAYNFCRREGLRDEQVEHAVG